MAAQSTSSSQKQRFSTLRLFNQKSTKPPLPPPKDEPPPSPTPTSTLHPSRSFLSIQTDHHLLSPYSSPSAAASSSSMSIHTAPPKSATGSPSSSKKPSIFSKFRKNKTVPQTRENDEGISLPWNFEHTIHVNETLVGLPPSWSNRLNEVGFSEEEIIAIQEARRAAGSVSLYRLNTPSTTRVDSPSTFTAERSTSPVSISSRGTRPVSPGPSSITQPSPRSTSLRRAKPPPPPLPTGSANAHAHAITPSMSSGLSSAPSSYSNRGPRRQQSVDSYHTTSSSVSGFNDSSMNVNLDDFSFPVPMTDTPNLSNLTQIPIPPQPQRRFVVTNATSPPPAYASGGFYPPPSDEKNRNLYIPHHVDQNSQQQQASSSTMLPPPPPIQDGEASPSYEVAMQDHQSFSTSSHHDELDSTPKTNKTTKRRSKRFSAAPPRLSLSLGTAPSGDDGDDWTKTLFSSIPSASGSSGFGLGLESTKEAVEDEDEEDRRRTIISSSLMGKKSLDDDLDKRRTIIAPLQSSSSSQFASSSSTSASQGTSKATSPSPVSGSSKRPSSSPQDAQSKSKPIPSIVLPTPAKPLDAPTWDEIMDTLDAGSNQGHGSSDGGHGDPKRYTDISYISAALSESQSPTLPISPTPTSSTESRTPTTIISPPHSPPAPPSPHGKDKDADASMMDIDSSRYSKSSYLSADEWSGGSRGGYRDSVDSRLSTQSISSTSTVTAHVHTIVNVERGVRAMASVVPNPLRPLSPPLDTVVDSSSNSDGSAATSTSASGATATSTTSNKATTPVFTPPATQQPSAQPSTSTPSLLSVPPPASKRESTSTLAVPSVKKPEPVIPSKIAEMEKEKEKDRASMPPWKAELVERARSTSTTNRDVVNKDSSSSSSSNASIKDKKKPSELLLPLPASSWGYSAVASNLAAARTPPKPTHTSSHSYHPQMFQGQPNRSQQQHQRHASNPTQRQLQQEAKKMDSPQSSNFSSEDGESSVSCASTRQSQPTPVTENDDDEKEEKKQGLTLVVPTVQVEGQEPGTPGILSYYSSAATGDSSFIEVIKIQDEGDRSLVNSYYTREDDHPKRDIKIDGEQRDEDEEDEDEEEEGEFTLDLDEADEIVQLPPQSTSTPPRPKSKSSTPPSKSPNSGKSVLKYQPWLAELLAPIRSYIDETVDCRDYYMELQEMAEGESGSVFSARVLDPGGTLKLPPFVRARETLAFSSSLPNSSDSLQNLNPAATGALQVAIKAVRLNPSGTPKLQDVQNELELLYHDGWHEHVLSLDALYVDIVDDALWIRMEMMERSIADVLAMVEHGLMLQERMIARFASDTTLALEFLESQGIAHRDVRSDNLLINRNGIVKLADFSNAIRTSSKTTALTEPVGVLFWQPPEMRRNRYNAAKVDVWSLGATVWEMAESQPPFSDGTPPGDRWPPISQPTLFSPAFHEFLRMCSEPEERRPSASKLVKAALTQNACGRSVIVHLLSQCMTIEAGLQEMETE